MDTTCYQFSALPALADTLRVDRLHQHRNRLLQHGLKTLFESDGRRFDRFHVEAAGDHHQRHR